MDWQLYDKEFQTEGALMPNAFANSVSLFHVSKNSGKTVQVEHK